MLPFFMFFLFSRHGKRMFFRIVMQPFPTAVFVCKKDFRHIFNPKRRNRFTIGK